MTIDRLVEHVRALDASTGVAWVRLLADVDSIFLATSVVLMEQGKGLFDDVAQLAQAFGARRLRLGDDRFGAAFAAACRKAWLLYPLSASSTSKRRRGRPGRPAIGGKQSSRSRARLMSGRSRRWSAHGSGCRYRHRAGDASSRVCRG